MESIEEANALLCRGNEARMSGETNMNERSSRSHVIIKLVILGLLTNLTPLNSGSRAEKGLVAARKKASLKSAPFLNLH